MPDSKPSNEAVKALEVAQDALKMGQRQEADIDAAKKLSYQAANKLETHEQICALRAEQTLAKVGAIDTKLDRLISVLLGAAKIITTAVATGAVGIIIWLVQTNGA